MFIYSKNKKNPREQFASWIFFNDKTYAMKIKTVKCLIY
jgi:hypothetical protein